jgi:hypothetical protein
VDPLLDVTGPLDAGPLLGIDHDEDDSGTAPELPGALVGPLPVNEEELIAPLVVGPEPDDPGPLDDTPPLPEEEDDDDVFSSLGSHVWFLHVSSRLQSPSSLHGGAQEEVKFRMNNPQQAPTAVVFIVPP